MKYYLIFFLLFSFFLSPNNSYSQLLITDTISKNYYLKYEVDETSRKKNGSYDMVYKNMTLTKGNYKNDERTGIWKFFGVNDTLQQKGAYVDGYKDGVWEFYYPDGKISCIMPYKQGKKNGVFKGFFKNGNTSFETNYVNDNAEGVSTEYYENGKVAKTETFLGDSLNGIAMKYYENGNLKEKKYMKGNKRDSVYLFYYEDASLWEHIIYKNGSPYNVIAYNGADGKPINCCTLKDGNGLMRFYDKEGRPTDEINYKNSQKNGYAKYSRKGIVSEEGNYLDGKYEGIWSDYYETGELLSKINYVKGMKEGEGIYYAKDGKIKQKGPFLKDEKSGMWTSYDEKGELESELNYSENRLDGEGKYYGKGKLICSGKHNKGQRIFVWSFYDKKGKVNYSYDYGYTFVDKKDMKPDYDNTPLKNSEKSTAIVEKMPSFPGGDQMMYEFIRKNIEYPQDAKEAGISGKVFINFVVDNTGEITRAYVIRGVYSSLDKEALRIVNVMPRWTPGVQNGRPVSVDFNLPIKYTIK